MKKAKNILLISYVFPPAGGVAVQRALSLARYLPENGFAVHVISCRNPSVPTMDPGLVSRIPEGIAVHRVRCPEIPFAVRKKAWALLGVLAKSRSVPVNSSLPRGDANLNERKTGGFSVSDVIKSVMRRVFCPDPEVVWVPFALRKARQIVQEHQIDTVLVTVPPFSSLLIGLRLKREFPQLRFVADFRDEWLGYYLNTFPFFRSEYIRKAAVRIERETAEVADLVVAVTPSVQREMRERYADLPAERFRLIPNGFDPEALSGFRARPHCEAGKRVVIGYAGTVHNTSNPRAYLDALDSLPSELRDRVETKIIGRVTEEQVPRLEGRKTRIRQLGFLPQDQAFRELEEVDYVLLIERHALTVPGKLLEYLATGKPILAVSPQHGEVARILRETEAGEAASEDDEDGVRKMLETAIRQCLSRGPHLPDNAKREDLIRQYDRRNLTREYARLMRGAKELLSMESGH